MTLNEGYECINALQANYEKYLEDALEEIRKGIFKYIAYDFMAMAVAFSENNIDIDVLNVWFDLHNITFIDDIDFLRLAANRAIVECINKVDGDRNLYEVVRIDYIEPINKWQSILVNRACNNAK